MQLFTLDSQLFTYTQTADETVAAGVAAHTAALKAANAAAASGGGGGGVGAVVDVAGQSVKHTSSVGGANALVMFICVLFCVVP
jgi:hypothetical protein